MASGPAKRKKSSPKRNNPDTAPRNKHSCKNCRRDKQKCKDYSHPSDPCGRCRRKGWDNCGEKLNTNKQPKPDTAPAVTPVPTPASAFTSTPAMTGRGLARPTRNSQTSLSETHLPPSAADRFRSIAGSKCSEVELLTCSVIFHVLLVSKKLFLRLLQKSPVFDEPRIKEEAHIQAIVSWLEDNFQKLMYDPGLPTPVYRLLEPLRKIQYILQRDPEPTLVRTIQPRSRTTSTVILSLWNDFEKTYPDAQDLLACISTLLSELYPGTFDHGSSTKEWDDSKLERSYGRLSTILNLIYGAYLSDRCWLPNDASEPPFDCFPYWQIAYQNKDTKFALKAWSRFSNQELGDADFSGLCLAHWAVGIEDIVTLSKMSDKNVFVGHFKYARLNISPCQLAVVKNSASSYKNLTNFTNQRCFISEDNNGCLALAAEIRSWDVVIAHALDSGLVDIAWELLPHMNQTWFSGELPELAKRARDKGFLEFARVCENMRLSEATASQALAAA